MKGESMVSQAGGGLFLWRGLKKLVYTLTVFKPDEILACVRLKIKGIMTRADAITRKQTLEERRTALVDQLAAVDAQSASVSSGGGSKSYTNRSVADIKAKIAFLDRDIARLEHRLGQRPSPGAARHIDITFNG